MRSPANSRSLLLAALGILVACKANSPAPAKCGDSIHASGPTVGLATRWAAVDINGDGWAEVVGADPARGVIAVFNVSDDLQVEAMRYEVGDQPVAVAAGDVDADGCIDIVAANNGSSDIVVLRCIAGGDPPPALIVEMSGPQAVTIRDLDGDGAEEVVAASALSGEVAAFSIDTRGEVRIWEALCLDPGTTGFAQTPASGPLWLMNGERGTLTPLHMDGQGRFLASTPVPTIQNPVYVDRTELAEDGSTTLIVRGLSQAVVMHEVDKSGDIGALMSGPIGTARAVLTRGLNPPRLDHWLAMSLDGSLLGVKTTGEVTQMWAGQDPPMPGQAHLLELTRGAGPSLIGLVDEGALLTLWRTDLMTIRFAARPPHVMEVADVKVLLTGDFDGDGGADVIVEKPTQQRGVVLGSEPAAVKWLPEAISTIPGRVVAGVFDGEPGLDLVFQSSVDDTITVLSGAGDGTFTVGVPWAPGVFVADMAAGDISGDGFDDLVITTSPALGARMVLVTDGAGSFGASVTLPGMGGTPAVLDIDGEGGLDVAFRTGIFGPGVEIVLSTAGEPQFVALTPLSSVMEFGGVPAVIDFDRDGLRDFVACSEGTLPDMQGPGLLVFPGTSNGAFDKALGMVIPDTSVPGLPEPIVGFWCRGVLVPKDADMSAITYGIAELGSGEHVALALTFTGSGEQASFVRGEVLSALAPGPEDTEEALFLADVNGDGVADALGKDKTGALAWHEGEVDMAFVRVVSGVSLEGGR